MLSEVAALQQPDRVIEAAAVDEDYRIARRIEGLGACVGIDRVTVNRQVHEVTSERVALTRCEALMA